MIDLWQAYEVLGSIGVILLVGWQAAHALARRFEDA